MKEHKGYGRVTLQHRSTDQVPGGTGAAGPWPPVQASVRNPSLLTPSHHASGDICMLISLRYLLHMLRCRDMNRCRHVMVEASISQYRGETRHFHRHRVQYRNIVGQLLSEKHSDFRNFGDFSVLSSMLYTHFLNRIRLNVIFHRYRHTISQYRWSTTF